MSNSKVPGSAAQYRPRILCRSSTNNNGTANVTTTNGIGVVHDLIISPNEDLHVQIPILEMEQAQSESILLNSLLAPTELNSGAGTAGNGHAPQEFVYLKLDEGQITNPTDSAENIIITLNEAQLGGFPKQVDEIEAMSESTTDTNTTETTSTETDDENGNEDLQSKWGISEEDRQEISNLLNEVLQTVVTYVANGKPANAKPQRKKSEDRKHVKSEFVPAQEVQLPLVWRDDIAFLPGTEYSFHVNASGNLVLHCPFLPVTAKMQEAVLKLNLKRSENHKVCKKTTLEEELDKLSWIDPEKHIFKVPASPRNALKKTGLSDNSNKRMSDSTEHNGSIPKALQTYKKKSKSSPSKQPTLVNPAEDGNGNTNTQPKSNEAIKSNSKQEFVKPMPTAQLEESKARKSEPAQQPEAVVASSTNPRNPKSRQSESALPGPGTSELVKSGKIPKSGSQETTVKTTFCFNCHNLGEVYAFIDGKYCSPICKRTTRMLAAEKIKTQAAGQPKEATKGKKKLAKSKASPNSAPATPDTKIGPPAPVIYAKKTTISPIEVHGGQTIIPQFLPAPRLDVNLQQFASTSTGLGEVSQGIHKSEPMEHGVVELRIEDRSPTSEPMDTGEEEDSKANPQSGRIPPRKHRKRASLTMRKRNVGQATVSKKVEQGYQEWMEATKNKYKYDKLGRPLYVETPGQIPQQTVQINIVERYKWAEYLKETKSKAAPARLFKEPVMPLENTFQVGMCLEAIDPVHQSLFCVVHVVEVLGFRLRLRFTGYAEVYDFWVNADSSEIFPCGWCSDHGQELLGPPDYDYDKTKPFNWHQYIVIAEVNPARRESFAIIKEDVPLENTSEVQVGMKLEAVDLKNINYICVATVGNVIGDRFLIHFDSWDNLFDYWTDLTSPFIHPVGWCERNGRELVPPQWGDERDTGKPFVWKEYLKETNSVPMPSKLFQPLPPVKFKKGMKLECVDKRTPSLIRVSTIAEVDSHFITIHFDGWDTKYDYPIYELSPDIHPIGWCAATNHALQPPPPPPKSAYWKKKLCPVYGCLGIGNIDGPKFPTHDSELNCPYAEEHYMTDFILGDRLVSYIPPPVTVEVEPEDLDDEPDVNVNVKRKNGSRRSSNASGTKSQAGSKRSSKTKSKRSEGRERKTPQRASQRGKRASVDQEVSAEESTAAAQIADMTSPVPKKRGRKSTKDQDAAVSEPVQVAGTSTTQAEVLAEVPKSTPETETKKTPKSSKREKTARTPKRNRNDRKSGAVEVNKSQEIPPAAPDIEMKASTSQQSQIPPQIPVPVPATAGIDQGVNELPPNFDSHIQGINKLVAGLNPSIVSKWGVEEVAAFVVKVGCSTGVSQKLIIEHKLDGESFLLLKQHDILSYGFPYGPAMKIANALQIINATN